MKKLIAAALAASMALSLAACGGSSSATSTTAAPAAAPAAETTAAETKAEAPAAEKVELTVAYADAEDSVFGKGCAAFAEKLEELSGGSMTCSIFPNGTLGSIPEVAAMIQQGTCDVSPIVTSSLVDFCPDLGVFDLPFMFADYDAARDVISGEVGTTLADKLEASSMHVGSWMTMGFREVTSSKPIESVADFKGLKIRTQSNEVHQAIFNGLGAAATVINFSELYTAMEQKTVDAQENPYVNIANNAYYEVQSYLVETNHVVVACGGGGIPVFRTEGHHLKGAAAVIDKDFAAEKLAEQLDADCLIILTAVEKAALHFGKPDEEWLSELTPEDAQKYIEAGEFAPGSMLPKVEAAVQFVRSAPGRTALITLLEKAMDGVAGKTGTHFTARSDR